MICMDQFGSVGGIWPQLPGLVDDKGDMHTPPARARLAIRTLIAAGAVAALAAGCSASVSVGDSSVPRADVEREAATRLAEEAREVDPDAAVPTVSCPGDLKAEVDASLDCSLTLDGVEGSLPVYVVVTSVEGTTVNYSVEAGDSFE
jgi:hypothetical protein